MRKMPSGIYVTMRDTTQLTQSYFPTQNIHSLNVTVFQRAPPTTMDWCTARQAQQIRDANIPPDSLLENIASGRIASTIYSQKEAKELLLRLQQRSMRKEGE